MTRHTLARVYNKMHRTGLLKPYHAVFNRHTPAPCIQSVDDSRKVRDYFYYGNNTALVETHYDCHLLLDLRDLSVAPTIIKTGWYEPWIDILLRSLLKPGMSYLNAGANFGYHTMLGGLHVRNIGHVYGFEPNPHIFQLLKRSALINGFLSRSSLYNAAVFDEAGESDFLFELDHQGGAGLGETDGNYMATHSIAGKPEFDAAGKSNPGIWSGYHKTVVKKVTIDETVGQELKQLNVLHMDIERSEGPALLGAMELIRRSPDIKIIIEQSSELPDTIAVKYQKALDFLVGHKFKFYRINPPAGNVYSEPPILQPVARDDLSSLPHCDLLITRS